MKIVAIISKLFKMSGRKLGVYSCGEHINLVEVEGRHIVSQVRLSFADISDQGVPPHQRKAEVLKEALYNNKIRAKKVLLGLSGQEQFIRSFQMIMLSKSELNMGVQFEVKKYIPFRTDDLASDYQYRENKKLGKMDVLFVAVTKNSMDTHCASLKEAGLAVSAVEPASLALLRILSCLQQMDTTIAFALVVAHGLEAEVTIIDQGFPIFSREIKLPAGSDLDELSFRGRLANEIRVSLDYYRRQFTVPNIEKILFLSKNLPFLEGLITGLSEDLSIKVEPVVLEKDNEINSLQDLDMLKAYALALKDTVVLNLRINLAKKRHIKEIISEAPPKHEKAISFDIYAVRTPLVLMAVALVAAYLMPQVTIQEFTAKLKQLQKEVRVVFPASLKDYSLDAIQNEKTASSETIAVIEKMMKSRSKIASLLNVFPYAVSNGLWIEDITVSFANSRQSIVIKGAVFSEDSDTAREIINAFYRKLKSVQNLTNMKLLPVNNMYREKNLVAGFEISGEIS